MSAPSYNKGFTLVELLVAIIIFVFMTALLVVKYGSFSQRMNLTNTAYDIALNIRQAQQYGINVTATTTAGVESFSKGYGMFFSSTTNSMLFFRDTNGSQKYNSVGSPKDDVMKQINLKQNNGFGYLCVGNTSATCNRTSYMSVVFQRPDPTPYISGASGAILKYGEINLFSANGATTTIVIRSTGQISIVN